MPKRKPQTRLAQASRSRPLTAPPPLVDASLSRIETSLGGRDLLVAALNHAPQSKDLTYVLGLLGDPTNASLSLGTICAAGGIVAGEILAAWQSGMLACAQLIATRQVSDGLPAVVGNVMRRAAPFEDVCSGCQGLGQVTPEPTRKKPNPEPVPCPLCRATGRLLYDADMKAVEIALDMGKMTSRSGGVNMLLDQRQIHLGGGQAAGGSLESVLAASDRILFGDDSPLAALDAEVLEPLESPGAQAQPEPPEPPSQP